MSITLINKDCIEVLRRAPRGSVDLVLADLPYGTTANKWDSVIPFTDLWGLLHRVAKESATFVMTATNPFSSALVCSNVHNFKHEWVWEKSSVTGHLNAKRKPMRTHEDVLVFCRQNCTYNPQDLQPYNKMKRRGNNGSNFGASGAENFQEFTNYPRSIISIPNDAKAVHPTQKPVDLMRYMIRTYSNPGETVLDPTMGSGTTGVAALVEGRKFIGIEQNKEYFEIASKRIKETVIQ